MAITKTERRSRIRKRIRKHISGTGTKPRMSVFRSSKQIYVQLVDDQLGKTLVSACSRNKEVLEKKDINKKEKSFLVGELLAKRAFNKGIKDVVFDRGGYRYHGRVKSLAEGARKGGLKF